MEHEDDIITVEPQTERQTYVDTSPTNVLNNQNKQIKKEYQLFTDYSNKKAPKDYEEYEIIQTYKPHHKQKKDNSFDKFVSEQNNYVPANETYVYEKTKPVLKRKKTSKIFISICCAIAVLMGTLGIVNAVNINSLASKVSSTTQEIANVGTEITKIDQVIEGMVSEEQVTENAESNGYSEVTTKTEIELEQKNEVTTYEGSTNIFDIICNFFMRLFGG